MLFVPSSDTRKLARALASEVDGLIFDLEDAVTVDKKAEAREWLRQTLLETDSGGRERAVRINALDTEFGFEDITVIVGGKPDSIVLPKVTSPQDILIADRLVSQAERQAALTQGTVEIIALMEMPEAIECALDIARSNPRLTGLLFGAGDFTRETHGVVTESRIELLYPMSKMVQAARIARIDALDSPAFNVRDAEVTEREALQAARLGYDGKTAIHPNQIEAINRVFTPSAAEMDYWLRVIDAFKQSEQEKKGATTVDGKVVEMPNVEMAARILGVAKKAGVLDEQGLERLNWAETALTSWRAARGR
jgi:citrate lyase subunit beta/citryl-CoA lyase